jgi:hypothetical protein
MPAAKKMITLAERVESLEQECSDALDRLAEENRPASVPARVIRQLWTAKAAGNVFHAYLVAAKEREL